MPDPMKIHTYPDEVLRTRAKPVLDIDEEILNLIERMGETMYAAPGIGLAANQVGELSRIIVYDLTSRENGHNLSVLINPEIVLTEGEIIHEEACLSVLDFSADVRRAEKVKVRGTDRDGNPADIEAEGLLAVCLQHEIDHLDGVLFIDHVSPLKRSLYKKRIKKRMKTEKTSS
jgi:peptide deformylase